MNARPTHAENGEHRRPAGVHPCLRSAYKRTRLHHFIPAALSLPFFAGCGPKDIQPIAVADKTRVTKDATIDWSDWGLTLSRVVQGREVNYRACLKDHLPLDRFLAHVARVGPNSVPPAFPEPDDRLAYMINCYNATILRSLLEFARDGSMPDRVPFNLEGRFRYRIDGEWKTPGQLRQATLDLAGDDWRVRFALCDGRRGGPPLWRRPFLGEMLDAQLNEVVRAAIASPQIVEIDHEWTRLRLWSGLYSIKDTLIREYEDRYKTRDATILSALLAYADRPRREQLNSAIGYDVSLLPSDNHINAYEQAAEDRGVLGLFSTN